MKIQFAGNGKGFDRIVIIHGQITKALVLADKAAANIALAIAGQEVIILNIS